jgi:hypothetical protein
MDAHAQAVVQWLLLVGAAAVGAVLVGVAQQHWWGRPAALGRPGAAPEGSDHTPA